MRRILKRSVESWSGVASQGAGLHNTERSVPSPQPTSSTYHSTVWKEEGMLVIRNTQRTLKKRGIFLQH